MGIDTPSDEFYTINTKQSGPPMSGHKLQPRLIRSNPNTKSNTVPKKPARQKWTGHLYLPGHNYKLLSQDAKDALQKYNIEAIQKFKSSRNLHETNFYMMYLNIHRIIPHYPMKKKSFKNVRNLVLTKMWSCQKMISWISYPVKNIPKINLIKFSKLIKHIRNDNLKPKLLLGK